MMNIEIKQSFDLDEKSTVVEKIMRSLPDWFSMESTIIKYKEEVKPLPFLIAYNKQKDAVGMMCLIEFDSSEIESIEIKVIGVMPEYQGHKIGRELIKMAGKYAKDKGKKHLTVKTLSTKSSDVFYQKTRTFYKSCGFVNLMDIIELWDDENPCLLMLKTL